MSLAIAISTEAPKVFFSNGRLVTTSQAVADYFDKQHKNILQKIDNLECSPEFTSANFSAHVENQLIGVAEREIRYFEITKDGFMFLVMGFTGKKAARLKEAYIAKFNSMEEELRQQSHRQVRNDLIHGDGRTLVIRLDAQGNIIDTREVPVGACVGSIESFRFFMEQEGWIVVSKNELTKAVNETVEKLLGKH
ncbi:Rha family transcriptional regulator [Salmonella enterica subsp. enterica]|nr:Rha family transcriptional regulator [Salmonella enterica subsp. enterica]